MSHYRRGATYLGQWADGATPPSDAVACPAPPTAFATWNGSAWVSSVSDFPVPAFVTKRQLMLACKETVVGESNWWALAVAAIGSQSQDVQDEWNLAQVIQRDNPAFLAFASGLGADSDDIDDVFRLAAGK